jgi:hypothetical protein
MDDDIQIGLPYYEIEGEDLGDDTVQVPEEELELGYVDEGEFEFEELTPNDAIEIFLDFDNRRRDSFECSFNLVGRDKQYNEVSKHLQRV